MKATANIARMFLCLVAVREKAEHLQHPAENAIEYAEHQQLFTEIAATLADPKWDDVLGELGGIGAGLRDIEGVFGKRALMNAYWMGEGTVVLGWLLGLLPMLPNAFQGINILDQFAKTSMHTKAERAQGFVSSATVIISENIASEALRRMEEERDHLIPEMRKAPDRQLALSRSLERTRFLGWALGVKSSIPKP